MLKLAPFPIHAMCHLFLMKLLAKSRLVILFLNLPGMNRTLYLVISMSKLALASISAAALFNPVLAHLCLEFGTINVPNWSWGDLKRL